VGVQSHYFGVGSLVSWAAAGVGAVATQSTVEPAYGPRGLELMRAGKSAPQVLHELLSGDPQERVRQVAMVDRAGRVAVHSGPGCIAHAGHAVGNQVSAQANIMRSETVPRAMVRAYDTAPGELAERLLAALDAAEGEGGDLRGRQSASLVVVAPRASGQPTEDRLVDLRVEDHGDPLAELRRLLELQRAYARADAGDQLAAAGDLPGALREYAAAHASQPDNLELAFWHGAALAANGSEQEATPILRRVFAAGPGFAELLERLPAAGLFPDDGQLIARLVGTRAESAPAGLPPVAAEPSRDPAELPREPGRP
jgi:uncharacterized Ntn-hydrolase superfamily protein